MSANDWGGVELEEEHNSNNVADEGFDVSENVHCSLDLYRSGYSGLVVASLTTVAKENHNNSKDFLYQRITSNKLWRWD